MLVNIPVACIREGSSHASEMSSQSIMGTPMKVLEDNGSEWLKLEGPDGYTGYMNISSVKRLSDTEMQNWKIHRDLLSHQWQRSRLSEIL